MEDFWETDKKGYPVTLRLGSCFQKKKKKVFFVHRKWRITDSPIEKLTGKFEELGNPYFRSYTYSLHDPEPLFYYVHSLPELSR